MRCSHVHALLATLHKRNKEIVFPATFRLGNSSDKDAVGVQGKVLLASRIHILITLSLCSLLIHPCNAQGRAPFRDGSRWVEMRLIQSAVREDMTECQRHTACITLMFHSYVQLISVDGEATGEEKYMR